MDILLAKKESKKEQASRSYDERPTQIDGEDLSRSADRISLSDDNDVYTPIDGDIAAKSEGCRGISAPSRKQTNTDDAMSIGIQDDAPTGILDPPAISALSLINGYAGRLM